MMGSWNTRAVATAYVDGRLYDARKWGGVRVMVSLPPASQLSVLLEPGPRDPWTARVLGVEEALTLAKELGARRVVVLCDDADAVRVINEGEGAEGDALGPYLRVRALLNQFDHAVVAEARALPAPDSRRLLQGFRMARVRPLGRPRNLSLFPQLAV